MDEITGTDLLKRIQEATEMIDKASRNGVADWIIVAGEAPLVKNLKKEKDELNKKEYKEWLKEQKKK